MIKLSNKNIDTNKRINYIDITRGVLISLVVLSHLSTGYYHNTPCDFSQGLYWLCEHSFRLFYMPAFFVVSGLCGNFNKPFFPFITSKIIGLKVPVFFFVGLMGGAAIRPIFGFSPFSLNLWFIRMFETGLWFLHAMFLSTIIYWGLNKYLSRANRVFFCFLLYFSACVLYLYLKKDIFWILHSVMLLPFLEVGSFLRGKTITATNVICSLTLFVVTVILISISGSILPSISENLELYNIQSSVLILILSVSGTVCLIELCKFIKSHKILEYVGKYSLVIYCVHGPEIVRFFCNHLTIIEQNNNCICAFGFILRLSLIIMICITVGKILDRPYVRIFIGKKI